MSPLQLDFLRHIQDECFFILNNTKGKSKSEIIDDPVLFRACSRSLEIIGEATKRLSREIRDRNPKVKWDQMAGMRDVISHDYDGIDHEVIWNVISKDISELEKELAFVIAAEEKLL